MALVDNEELYAEAVSAKNYEIALRKEDNRIVLILDAVLADDLTACVDAFAHSPVDLMMSDFGKMVNASFKAEDS